MVNTQVTTTAPSDQVFTPVARRKYPATRAPIIWACPRSSRTTAHLRSLAVGRLPGKSGVAMPAIYLLRRMWSRRKRAS